MSEREKKAGLAGDEPKPSIASVARGLQRRMNMAAQRNQSERSTKSYAAEAEARRVVWGDDDIAAAAAARLGWHKFDPSYQVEVCVDKGWMTLGGHVDWQFQKDAADQDLRRLLGVIGMTNHIQVRPEVDMRRAKAVRTG